MNRRRAIVILALVGGLDAAYLLLAKLGYIGTIACTVSNGCDLVNASRYSELFGLPVAGIGLAGYSALFAVALLGLQPRWIADRRPDQWLSLMSGAAVLFTLYLTYAELFILKAVCQWCIVSQVIVIAIFVLALIGVARRQALLRYGAGAAVLGITALAGYTCHGLVGPPG